MTRLEAIKLIRTGQTLTTTFYANKDGMFNDLEVWIRYQEFCDFNHYKQEPHKKMPLHLRFWSGSTVNWLHISPKQLLAFIKRNYNR
jgi:hypothetical protein